MNLTNSLIVLSGVFVFSMGAYSADTSNVEADSNNSESSDIRAMEETIGTTDENQNVQEETSTVLNEAPTSLGESVADLAEVLGDKVQEKYLDYIASTMKFRLRLHIEEYDSDNDGGLSKDELLEFSEEDMPHEYRPLTPDERRAKLEEDFKGMDLDEDGKITLKDVKLIVSESPDQLISSFQSIGLGELIKDATDSSSPEDGGRSD